MKHITPTIPKAISRTWNIAGTIPNPNPQREGEYYSSNFCVGAEAPTLEQAIEKVRKVFPTAILTSCNHRGDINIQ